MLLPLTFHLEPTSGLIMLAGIFYGAQYGGSTTAILVNLPGETSSVVTAIDGYQMALPGPRRFGVGDRRARLILRRLLHHRGHRHLRAAFGAGRPVFRRAGIFLADAARSDRRRGAGARLGDQGGGHDRARSVDRPDRHRRQHRRQAFHLRHPELFDGIDVATLAIGVFGIGEIISNLAQPEETSLAGAAENHAAVADRRRFPRAWPAVLRGTALGSVLGVLPGGGATLVLVCGLCAGKESGARSLALRPRRGRRRGRAGIRKQCRRANVVHSHADAWHSRAMP